MNLWKRLFEPRPFNQGYLPEENGHRVFYAEFGNPKGRPVLVFHGGPGGSLSVNAAKTFDLKKYRVLLFDQRGCGKSLPTGELVCNTTQDLLNDATRLLNYLNVNEKVVVRGGSWGSTLALLWAESNPEKVECLLLSQIFLADKKAELWETEQAALFYPEFVEKMNNSAQERDIYEYYANLINSDNAQKQLCAANECGCWEIIRSSLSPRWGNVAELDDEKLAELRIYINYAANKFFLTDNRILQKIDCIKNIPTLIVHNRLDFVCPPQGAYELHQRLPNSKLIFVPEHGHFGKLMSKMRDFEIRRFLKDLGI